ASWWDPDQRVSWCGVLGEIDPVEVRVRKVPPKRVAPNLPAPEQQILTQVGVKETLLRNWLHQHDLALIVSCNVITRDRADVQQPYNLAVPGGTAQTVGSPGHTIYQITHLQLFQGDQIRGYFNYDSTTSVAPGRRILPIPLHDPAAFAAMGKFLDTANFS